MKKRKPSPTFSCSSFLADSSAPSGMMRRAQVTVWIILGVFLLAAIILFFMVGDKRIPNIISPPEADETYDAQSFLSSCIEEKVEESVEFILSQGGLVDPVNYIYFNNTRVEYLCENIGFYEPCIQQHPALMSEMREEIKKDITPKIGRCYDEFVDNARSSGGEVSVEAGEPEVDLELGEDVIVVNVKKELTIKKNEETRAFDSFSFEIESSAYNLGIIAMEIAAQEADYCYFEYVGFRILYPRYSVEPYYMSDPTLIYTIRDTKTNEYMMVAIRGCAIPAGI